MPGLSPSGRYCSATVKQAAAQQDDVYTWQLAWVMTNHLHMRGLRRELEAVHPVAMEAADRLGDPIAQGHAHHGLAAALAGLHRLNDARAHVERAIGLLTESDEMAVCADVYRAVAWVAQQQDALKATLAAPEGDMKVDVRFATGLSEAGGSGVRVRGQGRHDLAAGRQIRDGRDAPRRRKRRGAPG